MKRELTKAKAVGKAVMVWALLMLASMPSFTFQPSNLIFIRRFVSRPGLLFPVDLLIACNQYDIVQAQMIAAQSTCSAQHTDHKCAM